MSPCCDGRKLEPMPEGGRRLCVGRGATHRGSGGPDKSLILARSPSRFDRNGMPLAIYVIIAVFGLWITLRLVASERQNQRCQIEHESRVRLNQELANLRRNGQT